MDNPESGHSLAEAANSILGLLDSDEEHTEPPQDDVAPESDPEEGDPDDSEADEAEEEAEESEEDEDESEEDGEEPAPPIDDATEVEIDGEKVTLKELKDSRLRLADYTRKTQALAEERKSFQSEAQTQRDQYAAGLREVEAVLAQFQPAQPDWDTLRKENPAEFAAQWAEHQQRGQQMAAVQAERQRIEQQQAAEQHEQLRTYLEDQKVKLLDAVPEWKTDKSLAEKERASLVEYARGLGFTDEDLGNVVDHRLVLLLRNAAKYQEIATKGTETIRVKKQTAKVLKPGGRDTSPRKGKRGAFEAASDRLKRSGRARDAAAVIEHMIDD